MAKDLSIRIPDATRDVIDKLKNRFKVTTDAEVLSRALGLANTAVDVAGNDNSVRLLAHGKEVGVTVTLNE